MQICIHAFIHVHIHKANGTQSAPRARVSPRRSLLMTCADACISDGGSRYPMEINKLGTSGFFFFQRATW